MPEYVPCNPPPLKKQIFDECLGQLRRMDESEPIDQSDSLSPADADILRDALRVAIADFKAHTFPGRCVTEYPIEPTSVIAAYLEISDERLREFLSGQTGINEYWAGKISMWITLRPDKRFDFGYILKHRQS